MPLAKLDKARHLTIEQENAIDLLLQGKTDREVAEAVGVSRQTVNQWRNQNPLFAAELNRRRQETWGSQLDRLRRLVAQAVDILEEDLKAQDRRLRQQAAIHILKVVGLYNSDLTPRGATEPEDIEADWRRQDNMRALTRLA